MSILNALTPKLQDFQKVDLIDLCSENLNFKHFKNNTDSQNENFFFLHEQIS